MSKVRLYLQTTRLVANGYRKLKSSGNPIAHAEVAEIFTEADRLDWRNNMALGPNFIAVKTPTIQQETGRPANDVLILNGIDYKKLKQTESDELIAHLRGLLEKIPARIIPEKDWEKEDSNDNSSFLMTSNALGEWECNPVIQNLPEDAIVLKSGFSWENFKKDPKKPIILITVVLVVAAMVVAPMVAQHILPMLTKKSVEPPIATTNRPAENFLTVIGQHVGETPETLAQNLLQEEKQPIASSVNAVAAFASFAKTSPLFQKAITLQMEENEQNQPLEPLLLLKAEENYRRVTDVQELLNGGEKISITEAVRIRKVFASIALEWQKASNVQAVVKGLPLELDIHRTLVGNVVFRKPELLRDLDISPTTPVLTCFFRNNDAKMLRFLNQLLIGRDCLMIGLLDGQIPEQADWREKWAKTKNLSEFRALLQSGLQGILLSIIQSQRNEWEKSFMARYKENPNFDWKTYDDALITGEGILKTTLSLLCE